MRAKKVLLSILVFLILTSLPIAVYALTVKANDGEIGSGAGIVNFDNFPTVDGFTITGSVVAEQSGSLERIIFQGMTITAPAVGCPCTLTITATGDASDFPVAKPPGGYPSAVVMSGFFILPDGSDPVGDKISLTGFAGAAQDAINATPGADAGTDTPASLPSACAGDPNCGYISDIGVTSFYDQIAETIQHECGELPECTPSLTVSVTLNFVNSGASVILPGGTLSAKSPGVLSDALPKPFSAFSGRLEGNDRPGNNKDTFDLNSSFTINSASNGIRCLKEEVLLSIGKSISISLPVGSMHESQQGACVFTGRRNGWDLQVVINQNGPVNFNASYRGSGGNLNGIVDGKPETVKLSIGDDYGSFLVAPDIR